MRNVQQPARDRPGRAVITTLICAATAAIVVCCANPTASLGAARPGPAGLAFYTPPHPLPGRTHGDLIWARRLVGDPALRHARNELVLYRSVSVSGTAIAVSGIVSVPRGRAPAGGWPVISFDTGTTGIADACAPSRDNPASDAHDYLAELHPLLERWISSGYAVIRTDYEGLGTPLPHPFLVGASEARTTLDIVRAARQLDPSLSRRVVIAGHSVGGHAALFASAWGPRWTPELIVRGTVALAPASHISEQAAALKALTAPSPLSGFAALAFRGLEIADPGLHIARLLGPRAAVLYPDTLTTCWFQLRMPSLYGALAPAQLFRPAADISRLVDAFRASDPEKLRINSPVLIEQGTADTLVFPAFTGQLAAELGTRGTQVAYHTYPGADHETVLTVAAHDANRWIAQRFATRGRARPTRLSGAFAVRIARRHAISETEHVARVGSRGSGSGFRLIYAGTIDGTIGRRPIHGARRAVLRTLRVGDEIVSGAEFDAGGTRSFTLHNHYTITSDGRTITRGIGKWTGGTGAYRRARGSFTISAVGKLGGFGTIHLKGNLVY